MKNLIPKMFLEKTFLLNHCLKHFNIETKTHYSWIAELYITELEELHSR